LGQRRRQAKLGIAPGIAVGIVGKQAPHHLVGRAGIPQCQERRDDVLEAPEEVIGPGEAFLGIALAAEEVGLPGAVGGDAGDFVDLGLIGHRIGGVGCAGGDDEIDLVAQDQLGGDLGGAAGVRLGILGNDLDLVGLAAAGDALVEDLLDLIEDVAVRF